MVDCQDREATTELEARRAQANVEDRNKKLVRSYLEEMNAGNTGLFEELCAPEYGYYLPSNSQNPLPREPMFEFLATLFRAFPDINWSIEEMFAEEDRVIVSNTITGTHEGEFQGIPATGKKINISSILMYRFKNGKIVEEREENNSLGFMQQLGMDLRPTAD